MSMVNTNYSGIAALQSLTSYNQQTNISNPTNNTSSSSSETIYSISQTASSRIQAGIAGLQDEYTNDTKITDAALKGVTDITNVLSNLNNVLADQQAQYASRTTMNATITKALDQVNEYVKKATVDGTNLIAGATGNGVTATSIAVHTDLSGNSFQIGGDGVKALNATTTGLGLDNLGISNNDTVGQAASTINSAIRSLGNVKATLLKGEAHIAKLQELYGEKNQNLTLSSEDEQSQALAKLITAKPGSAFDTTT